MRKSNITPFSKKIWLSTIICGYLLGLVASGQVSGESMDSDFDDEDTYELSPFVIETDDAVGYLATSTLAGTRIKTDLKDLGSAISVVTPEFMEDTGATNMEDLLVYTTGTEVGGALGNFAGSGVATGNEDFNSQARGNPSSNNRMRGLSTAAITRNYFLASYDFDGYNTEMVTINRGPNSILFGIGEPGGVVNNTLKQGVFGKNFGSVSARIGSHGSTRYTLDLNREIIEDRLVVRVAALNEDITFRQKPTYEDDRRYYATATAKLFKNDNVDWMGPTLLRANWEHAKKEGTPPSVIAPTDGYSTWWRPPASPFADDMVGLERPEGYYENYASHWVVDRVYPDATTPGERSGSAPGIWDSYAIIYNNPNGEATVGYTDGINDDVQVIHGATGAFLMPDGTMTPGWFPMDSSSIGEFWQHAGFKNKGIPLSVYNWENRLIQGKLQYANHQFDAKNFVLEQNFFNNKAGIELAYDNQERESETFFPFGRASYSRIIIDASSRMTNGAPNPNVGRPMFAGMLDPINFSSEETETKRATVFYELDFSENENWTKWFGKHTFTGLFSKWEKENRSHSERLSWDTSHDKDQNFVQEVNQPGSWGGSMFVMAYLGDPQFDVSSPDQLKLYDGFLNIKMPKVGEFYNNYYYNSDTNTIKNSTARVRNTYLWPRRSIQKITSEAATVQSKFLDGHLVGMLGWRDDRTKTWQTEEIKNIDETGSMETYSNWRNNGDPVLDASGETITKQLVLHVPEKWTAKGSLAPTLSFHWAESENFNPSSVRRDIYNRVIGPPSGETTEKGFTVGLWDGRASVRANWYETSSNNVTNPNIQNEMYRYDWALQAADRWLSAKNSWINGGASIEEIGWGPDGPDAPGAVYDPTATGDFTSFDEIVHRFLYNVMPQETLDAYDPQIVGEPGNERIIRDRIEGLSSVADVLSEGFELEAVVNITSSWRVAFNVSKTESTFGNGLKSLTPYAEVYERNLRDQGLWDLVEGFVDFQARTGSRWTNGGKSKLAAAAAKEGTVSTELRKWRWNAVTNYQFSDGVLKGLGIGGAIRWEDEISTGYPLTRDDLGNLIPVLDKPFKGDSLFHGDLWFSYKTEVKGYPLKVQLNLQNFIGDDDLVPVAHNPDGVLAIARSAPEKRWFLTTTIEF